MELAAEFRVERREVFAWFVRDITIFEREIFAVFALERKLAGILLVALDNGFRPSLYGTRQVSLKWRPTAALGFVAAPEDFWVDGCWWTSSSG
jgi:hypothetical protein